MSDRLPSWFEEDRWVPPPGSVERRRLTAFMRREDIPDYATFLRRSEQDPEWFYRATFDFLGLDWPEPYTQLTDTSDGVPWTRWFVGGKTNLCHLSIDRWLAQGHGDRLAVVGEQEDGKVRRLTYAELGQQVEAAAHGLRRLGVGKGDVVALFVPMVVEAAVAFLAAARIGAIAAPAFSGYGADALAERLRLGRAKVLVTADGFTRRGEPVDMKTVADEAVAASETVEHVVVVERIGSDVAMRPGRDLSWAALCADPPAVSEPPELFDPETPFLLAFTSGSTGRPKGAIHGHGRMPYRLALELALSADMGPDSVSYWPSDMGWIMGPIAVLGAVTLGGTCVLFDGFPAHPEPDRLWQLVERHGITHLGSSPTLVRSLAAQGERWVEPYELDSLEVIMSTGEPMTSSVWRWLHRHVARGIAPIINLSGGTEVGCAFLTGTTVLPMRECTFGSKSPGIPVRVLDESGQPVVGKLGELAVVGTWPAMTIGFWDEPERYLETYWSRWPDVWVHGDRAIEHPDGSWELPGRSDDLLKVAGKRVGPSEYESLASEVPGVVSAAAVGVPHELKGEVATLVVEAGPGGPEAGSADRDELVRAVQAHVEAGMGKAMRPETVLVVDELPLTRSGKVHRRAVRAWLTGTDPGDLSNLDNPRSEDAIVTAGKRLRAQG